MGYRLFRVDSWKLAGNLARNSVALGAHRDDLWTVNDSNHMFADLDNSMVQDPSLNEGKQPPSTGQIGGETGNETAEGKVDGQNEEAKSVLQQISEVGLSSCLSL